MLIDLLLSIVRSNQVGLEVMGIFIVLDIITGLIKAVIEKDLQSGVMRTGILKKLLEVILVIVAALLDALLATSYIATCVSLFLIGMEGLSILENIGSYIPLPEVLSNTLEALKDKGKGE